MCSVHHDQTKLQEVSFEMIYAQGFGKDIRNQLLCVEKLHRGCLTSICFVLLG